MRQNVRPPFICLKNLVKCIHQLEIKNERKNKLEGYIYAEHGRYKEKNNHADRTDERKGP